MCETQESDAPTLRRCSSPIEIKPMIYATCVDNATITAAISKIVQPHNHQALLSLRKAPLSFRPSQWPAAFQEGSEGCLYHREDKAPMSVTLHDHRRQYPADGWYADVLQDLARHEDLKSLEGYVKYAGETTSADTVTEAESIF
ncbi:hypothetical protein CF327_g835 [Tilletia walkeri]|nr:hypothetical protein CF327_g835 [Tilletia walkeri]